MLSRLLAERRSSILPAVEREILLARQQGVFLPLDVARFATGKPPVFALAHASKASPRWRTTWNLSNKIAAFGACAAVARRNGRHISITARQMRPLFFAPSQT